MLFWRWRRHKKARSAGGLDWRGSQARHQRRGLSRSNPIFLVLKRYSAFLVCIAPTPLADLKKPVFGQFPCVLAALRGLDVYAERHVAKRYGCFAFGCPVFCLWENRRLGEALCRGRSPELTRSAVLVFGGSVSTPFRGSVVLLIHSALNPLVD